MTEEKKVQYFNIALCRAGMFLIGLGLIRALSIHQDQLSFLLGFGGFLMISIHIQALEKRWGIPKKYTWISTGIFALLFIPFAYWLAFPGLQ